MPATALTDLERRTIANLSIPRNAEDLAHELRVDPYSVTRSAADVAKHLLELAEAGLVVNLGEHEDPAKLAASLERHKTALTIPDEKAAIYAARVSVPHRRWRTVGDLWLLTKDGLDLLKEPTGYAGPADRATVERMLRDHARAVVDPPFEGSIHDEDGGRLRKDVPLSAGKLTEDGQPVATLLPEEYKDWAKAVSDAYRAETGEKLTPPMMGGMPGYSDATELLILDADGAKTASYAETAPTYMALSILAFTDADTGTTADDASHIPTYTGYARKSIAATDLNSAAAGARTNSNAIIFAGCTGGSSTVVGFARCSAATLGRIIRYGTCASTTISSTQTPAQFAAGAYTDTLD